VLAVSKGVATMVQTAHVYRLARRTASFVVRDAGTITCTRACENTLGIRITAMSGSIAPVDSSACNLAVTSEALLARTLNTCQNIVGARGVSVARALSLEIGGFAQVDDLATLATALVPSIAGARDNVAPDRIVNFAALSISTAHRLCFAVLDCRANFAVAFEVQVAAAGSLVRSGMTAFGCRGTATISLLTRVDGYTERGTRLNR